jgi:phenylpropionate dioxygenase-like ring-hydroxylating dioxygenase large terminal subunit
MSPLETAAPSRWANRGEAQARHEDFASAPNSWYYLGHVAEISRKPLRFELPDGQVFVAFRTESGRVGVLSARCCHMGSDLSRGCVIGERLACSLHGWEYGTSGQCERIPIQAEIPVFARQTSYPVEERGGHIFFFNQPMARYPLPFFEGLSADDLRAAPLFEFSVTAPWYLVSANGFDLQHFRCAHDRTLVGEPKVSYPHPFACRLEASFQVTGSSMMDKLTRLISGTRVEMTITNWCGNLVLVTARFARTTTYGLVSFVPLAEHRTLVRDIVWVRRSRGIFGQLVFDPVDAWIRRLFIREFVRSDAHSSDGLRYDPRRMIAADKTLVDYLNWLKPLANFPPHRSNE